MAALVLYPFRFRDPLTGKWIRARHKLQVPELQTQYAEWEITGAAEMRHVTPLSTAQYNPFTAPARAIIARCANLERKGIHYDSLIGITTRTDDMKLTSRASGAIIRRLMRSKTLSALAETEINNRNLNDWCSRHPCKTLLRGPYDARYQMYEELVKNAGLGQAIDYLEFGVFTGRSIKWWLDGNRHPDSSFIGFDSFIGLPENWRPGRERGTFSTKGQPPKIDDPRCRFEVGWFRDTLPPFVKSFSHLRRTVVHLDADLYSSTLFVLAMLAPVLRESDILIFDELHDSNHEGRALLDFQSAFDFEFETIVGINGHGRAALMVTRPLVIASAVKVQNATKLPEGFS